MSHSRKQLRNTTCTFLRSALLAAAVVVALSNYSFGQRARFGDFFQTQPLVAPTQATSPFGALPQLPTVTGQPPGFFPGPGVVIGQPAIIGQPLIELPQGFSSPPSITTTPPPSQIIAPAFDPFRAGNQSFPIAPTRPRTTVQVLPPAFQQPPSGFQALPPAFQQPPSGFQVLPPTTQLEPVAPRRPDLFGAPGFNQQAPFIPRSQFQPLGSGDFGLQGNLPAARWPSVNWAWPSQAWARLRSDVFPRLFERPRARHTWLQGNNGNEFDINTLELATTLTLPTIGAMRQPFRLTPGFNFDWWNGPDTDTTGFDLPSQAYSAFLALDHVSDPRQRSGLESNFTIGVYSDFENFNSDALRFTGLLLGWTRLNEINTLKFGVEYLDRVKVKLLPAFGVFIAPTPDLKLDVYFPRPRIAQRIPNFSDFEVWAYVGAEYGGGSWSIERPIAGIDDRVDVNDVRAVIGLEWLGPRRVTGFLEAGYAFERELVFESGIPDRELELQDTFLLRLGFAL